MEQLTQFRPQPDTLESDILVVFEAASGCDGNLDRSVSRLGGGFWLMASLASQLIDGYGRANKSSLPQPSQSVSEAGMSRRGRFHIQIP